MNRLGGKTGRRQVPKIESLRSMITSNVSCLYYAFFRLTKKVLNNVFNVRIFILTNKHS